MEQPAEPTPIHDETTNGRYNSMVRRNEERRARERRLLGGLTEETSSEPETIIERMRLIGNDEDAPDVNISL
jgi:hypothetical protein